jgi:hypothetical protein
MCFLVEMGSAVVWRMWKLEWMAKLVRLDRLGQV